MATVDGHTVGVQDGLPGIPQEEAEDAIAELTRVRRTLLEVVYAWTPSNWYESPDSMRVLDMVKAVLTPRQVRALREWLAKRER